MDIQKLLKLFENKRVLSSGFFLIATDIPQ